jgi:uncharacterized SAM-binding protein YcdF (DUF218 family)
MLMRLQLQLRPTPWGEIADVVTRCFIIAALLLLLLLLLQLLLMMMMILLQVTLCSDAPGAFLGAYSYILLAGGDLNFTRESGNTTLPDELLHALLLSEDTRLLLQAYHVRALKSAGRWDDLNATGANRRVRCCLFVCDIDPFLVQAGLKCSSCG